jgi:hypothetical protein
VGLDASPAKTDDRSFWAGQVITGRSWPLFGPCPSVHGDEGDRQRDTRVFERDSGNRVIVAASALVSDTSTVRRSSAPRVPLLTRTSTTTYRPAPSPSSSTAWRLESKASPAGADSFSVSVLHRTCDFGAPVLGRRRPWARWRYGAEIRGGSRWHDVGEVAVAQMLGYGRL